MIKKRTQTDAAAELIASAKRGQHMAEPNAKALAVLEKVLAYNDGAPHKRRVSAEAMLETLHGFGWLGARPALDSLCRRRFGRRSYGTP